MSNEANNLNFVSYKNIAIRMFNRRHEVKDDWTWRRAHREQIRGHIASARQYESLVAVGNVVTVLWHVENHRDRVATIIGVFDNKPPYGSGKINRAINAAVFMRQQMGIQCSRDEFRLMDMVVNKPEVVF